MHEWLYSVAPLISMRIPAVTFFVLIFAGCNGHTSPSAPNWDGKLSDKFPEQVRTALEQAQEFELLSLDPKHRDESAPTEFYRRRVVGKTTIKDAATRNRLLGAFDASVRADKDKTGAGCFNPRHAIRVQHSGKTFYLVICFHCANVYIYADDDLEHQDYIQTDMSPLSVFDEVLKAAKVPLAVDGELEDKLDAKPNRR
jgi:hypothetical protein